MKLNFKRSLNEIFNIDVEYNEVYQYLMKGVDLRNSLYHISLITQKSMMDHYAVSLQILQKKLSTYFGI